MARALLIVDPQYDFINGSLPVPGAAPAMDALAAHVAENADNWALKIITCDFHPGNHCSFQENGGQWPRHCVAHSKGAAIWESLWNAAYGTPGQCVVLPKGEQAAREEYSIFQAQGAARRIDELFLKHKINDVDICGIAGDICVLNTLKDGVDSLGKSMFTILRHFSPSLDGGKALADYCREETICIR